MYSVIVIKLLKKTINLNTSFRLVLESLITVQYTYITCISVSQQSTDETSDSVVAYKDSYWSDSWPKKCLEEINARKQK